MSLTVGQLEAALFAAFPREDAEPWDQPGLAVGDRAIEVTKVAVALDCTPAAVIEAAAQGCNALVTHHPPFIKEGPIEFGPQSQIGTTGPGRMIYEAARLGVAVICMHTNCDRAVESRDEFTRLLGWECLGAAESLMDSRRSAEGTGFGAVYALPEGTTLQDVAQRCKDALGGAPRTWGNPATPVSKVAYLNGGWSDSDLYKLLPAHGINVAIVGEMKYHIALDFQPYLNVVELGHDVSEYPLVDVLKNAVIAAGVPSESVFEYHRSAPANWWAL